MNRYPYEIVNVFAEQPFGGNPLAVFTDARGLDDATMLALARQLNLSETVFLLPSTDAAAVASLRIFTPGGELPFAGHPTLGSAAVLRRLRALADDFSVETRAGLIPITHRAGRYTLGARPATQRAADASRAEVASMLGLDEGDIAADPIWVNSGNEQLLVRIASRDAVLRARPRLDEFLRHATLYPGRSMAYLWYAEDGVATVRFLFAPGGELREDPGTGSACTNLGGWCALHGLAPLSWRVEQGEVIGRPNVLYLDVDDAGRVSVGGRVQAVGQGEMWLPAQPC